ncbi:MAG: TolC family protein [Bacteroidales bacterium]|nr:TolC family protein [Bacteroidales bacterium]
MISTKIRNGLFLALTICLVANPIKSMGQTKDSLSLNAIISEVVQNHPSVKKAMEELNSTDAKIGIAKAGYLPNAEFTASYSRIGPVSKITLPGTTNSFSLMPTDNYSAAFSVNQSIYDFGKTDKSISLEKQAKELSRQSVEQVKQRLSQAVIANYYSLVYLQEAIKIKEEQLSTLNEHLRFVEKKQATGSATQYEILTTQVRISAIENQKIDLEAAHQVQVSQLNSLLGQPENSPELVKNEIYVALPDLQSDALIASAIQNRDEMKLAREKAKLADLRYSLTNSQNNASLNGFVTGGIKNGYIPYMYDPTPNFAAGVTFKIPIYDGKRAKYNLVTAKSAISVNDQETEITRRNIVNEVVEMQSGVKSAQKRVEQSELMLKQATQAYSLAKVRFESGVITNLELLEGSTSVSESRLMLLKAKIDYTVNLYKLKSAIGERLY